MNAQFLASTPLFVCSLVVCAFVAGYACTVLLRAGLSMLSTTIATAGMDPSEMRAINTAGTLQKQIATLDNRMKLAVKLSKYLPELFEDSSWHRLVNTYEQLKKVEKALTSLLQGGRFKDGLLLGKFLTGETSTIPKLNHPIEESLLRSLLSWQLNSTHGLQRMVAKVEDALHATNASDELNLPQDFFDTLSKVRKGIVYDEERYQ
jgi:hypothetical protein